MVVVLAIGQVAAATNVIREWGGHSPGDYVIEQTGPHDVGVIILANTQPGLPWKFEAYDSITDMPGDIEYIRIDPSVTVGDIKLSVIGDPQWHAHGARNLDLLDLVEHGTLGNVIEVIDIAGHCGTVGDVRAAAAESITIGGDLGPYDIHVGSVTGDIRVEGHGPHTGSLIIDAGAGPDDGDIYFAGPTSGDITIGDSWIGSIEIDGDVGGTITINGDLETPGEISVYGILDDQAVGVRGSLPLRCIGEIALRSWRQVD